MANTRTHARRYAHADELQKQPPWETVNSPNHRVHERVRGESWESKALAYNEHAGQGWNTQGTRNDKDAS